MRDPKRIDDVINALAELWKRNPDWRFMQLIDNIQRCWGTDMFYVEDDEFINYLHDLNWGSEEI